MGSLEEPEMQRILVVRDVAQCREGQGNHVLEYLGGLSDRVARRVASNLPHKPQVLAIDSRPFMEVVFASNNFFKEVLDEGLMRQRLPFHVATIGMYAGPTAPRFLEMELKKALGRDHPIGYLGDSIVPQNFTAYRLLPR